MMIDNKPATRSEIEHVAMTSRLQSTQLFQTLWRIQAVTQDGQPNPVGRIRAITDQAIAEHRRRRLANPRLECRGK